MIKVIAGHDTPLYPELMDQVYRLRHKVFVDEMGWEDLRSPDGRELDQFDTPDAVHHVAVRDGRVVGYQRMLPTTQPHLLSDVFPELCLVDQPCNPQTYELTRYCVDRTYREGRRGVGSVGSELVAGFVEWGLLTGVNKVIIEFEPMWIVRGLQWQFFVRPLGLEVRIGKQKIVASEVTFNNKTLDAIRNHRGSHEPVVELMGSLDPATQRLVS